MTAPLTSPSSVVNAAIQMIGGYNNENPVSGTPPLFDGSKLGLVAGAVYNEVVYTTGRFFNYDFERSTVALVTSGNIPRIGWAQEYLYPANCLQLFEIMPITGADPNNPLPHSSLVGNVPVGTPPVPTKVIWTNVVAAQADISNTVPEGLWDAAFQEAVVRALAAKLALGGVGKPDFYKEFDESSSRVQSASEMRQG